MSGLTPEVEEVIRYLVDVGGSVFDEDPMLHIRTSKVAALLSEIDELRNRAKEDQ